MKTNKLMKEIKDFGIKLNAEESEYIKKSFLQAFINGRLFELRRILKENKK